MSHNFIHKTAVYSLLLLSVPDKHQEDVVISLLKSCALKSFCQVRNPDFCDSSICFRLITLSYCPNLSKVYILGNKLVKIGMSQYEKYFKINPRIKVCLRFSIPLSILQISPFLLCADFAFSCIHLCIYTLYKQPVECYVIFVYRMSLQHTFLHFC